MKRFILRLAYATGLFGLYHRYRNRNALTVISLHRVLATSDPRWQTCDLLYTISDRLFEHCLEFLSRHYSVVSLADVERAVSGGESLPHCPLLITFDDGWADNHEYALPALRSRALPAALFVAADVLERREGFFQERIIGAWRSGRLGVGALRDLWGKLVASQDIPVDLLAEGQIRSLIGRLRALPIKRRNELLECIAVTLEDGTRQMLTVHELRDLRDAGFAIGTHGKTHEALTAVPDAEAELRESRAIVAAALAVSANEITGLSFPFSKHDAATIKKARDAGYRLLFGGGLTLNPMRRPLQTLLARVGITAGAIADADGNLRPEVLAAYLFRRPHGNLEPG